MLDRQISAGRSSDLVLTGWSAPVTQAGIPQHLGHSAANCRAHLGADLAGPWRSDQVPGDWADGRPDRATHRLHLVGHDRHGAVVVASGQIACGAQEALARLRTGSDDLLPRIASTRRRLDITSAAVFTTATTSQTTTAATVLAMMMVMLILVLMVMRTLFPLVMSAASSVATAATAASPSATSTAPRLIELSMMFNVVAIHRLVVVRRTPLGVSKARTWLSRIVRRLLLDVVPDSGAGGRVYVRKQMIRYGGRVVEAEDLRAGDADSERQAGDVVVAVGVALDESSLAAVTTRTRAAVQLGKDCVVHFSHVIKVTYPALIAARHHLHTSTANRLFDQSGHFGISKSISK